MTWNHPNLLPDHFELFDEIKPIKQKFYSLPSIQLSVLKKELRKLIDIGLNVPTTLLWRLQ
jgi:hypothetical protein